MRKENVNLILVMVFFLLLFSQLSINLCTKNEKEEVARSNSYNETIEEFVEDINVLEILDTIDRQYININNLKKENNKWRGSVTINAGYNEVIESINILKELQLNIENYKIEKNEGVMVYLEVIFP